MTGSIVTFDDAIPFMPIEKLVAQIEPQQDLHGYDAPWAGGAGKNLFDQDTCTTGMYIDAYGVPKESIVAEYTDYIPVTVGQQYTYSGTNKTGGTASATIHCYNSSKVWVQQLTAEWVDSEAKWNVTFTVPEGISFVRVSTGYPLPDGQLEKGTTATAWSPYANICPISGHTGLSVEVRGKNLVEDALVGYNLISNGTFEVSSSFKMNIAKVKAGVQYAITTSDEYFIGGFFADKPTPASTTYNSSRIVELTSTFVAPIDGYVVFRSSASFSTPQLEVGSTASTYEEYTGEAISVSFGQTVYGGTDEIVSGSGTSTMGIVDLGDLNWYYDLGGGNPYFYTMNFDAKPKADQSLLNNAICSQYEQTGYNAVNENNGKFGISAAGTYLKVCDTRYTNSADFKSAMAGVMLCYELATPQTFTHTGQSVDTLKGQNNVWLDTGDVSVTYQSTSGSTPVRTSLRSPLASYSYSALKLFGNTFIEHGKG